MDKYIGRLLDNRYEILEVLGTGGMAVVYKARCHRLNRLVAIKILKDDFLEDEEFRARFHSESQAVAMLSHSNIVSVYDVSTSVTADYIVMELIDGITLKQYMEKKGVLNWKETLHFAIQIAKALEHAHEKGIVHRDIKPHNVMVLKNGSVKVMDFGIARLISHGNTLTKEALGSVHYISPEQARGGRIDDRSDIYSLGVVMYEMMAGRPPYDGESPVAVAIQHINGGASLPSLLNPNIPGGLEQIIMKAMARNLSDRYPSATRMLADMDEFRKDPTMLFDYTGLPLDAAIRVQKVLSEKENAERNAEQGIEEQVAPISSNQPKPVTVPKPDPERYRQHRERSQSFGMTRSRGTTLAIIICAAVALVATIIFMVVSCSNQNKGSDEKIVKVPQFVGEQLSDFSDYKDLIIMKEEVYDENIPAGEIISQTVEAGTERTKGSRVEVVVSLGPQPTVIPMPDLQNKTREEALAALSQLGFSSETVEIVEKNDDNVPVDSVISTEPAKDSQLTKDTKITLYISKGQKITTLGGMPNVVGETREKAEEILNNQKMNLQIEIEEVFDPVVAVGIVVGSEPDSGVGLKANDKVILRVSKGIEMKQMPSMVGMSLTEAKNKLKELGFTKEPVVKYLAGVEAEDTVVSQLPEAEKEYELGVEITLEVSDGSLVPKTVTKNVVIDLKGRADESRCGVTIKREGQKDIELSVPKGTPSVELIDEVGAGMVYYTVIINDTETWTHIEEFAEETEPTEATQEAAASNG